MTETPMAAEPEPREYHVRALVMPETFENYLPGSDDLDRLKGELVQRMERDDLVQVGPIVYAVRLEVRVRTIHADSGIVGQLPDHITSVTVQ